MSQLSLSLDTPLMVRDGRGRYRPADADQILEAARQVIEQKMQRGEAFTSPEAVKDYLRAKLAGFEHEVFAVLFLDTRHRLIDYVEMFDGTIDAARFQAYGCAWTIACAGMLMLALVFQFLAVARPKLDSGLYAYAKHGFGDYVGFLSAIGYWASLCASLVTFWILVTST